MKINKFINTALSATKNLTNTNAFSSMLCALPLVPALVLCFNVFDGMGFIKDIKYNNASSVDLSYKVSGNVDNKKYEKFFDSLLLDKGLLLNMGFSRKELNVGVGLHDTDKRGEHYSLGKDYIQLYLRDFESYKPVYNKFQQDSLQVGLFNIFQSNEKVLSYIFFHEFAHKVDVDNNFTVNQVNALLGKIKGEGEIKYDPDFIKRVKSQSNESFADAFAIKMMSLRYGDVKFDETRRLVAGLRNYELRNGNSSVGYDIGYGLVLNNKNPPSSKDGVINYARIVAMDNNQFEYDYKKIHNRVNKNSESPKILKEKVNNTLYEIDSYKKEFQIAFMDYEKNVRDAKIDKLAKFFQDNPSTVKPSLK